MEGEVRWAGLMVMIGFAALAARYRWMPSSLRDHKIEEEEEEEKEKEDEDRDGDGDGEGWAWKNKEETR